MQVIKASGEREEFKADKIMGTCLRAGASRELAEKIVKEVEKKAYDGISTREILHRTLKLLKKKQPGAASRYDLKRGIMSLGPTGFPFEKFFAEVLQEYGYETKVGKILQGECVEHEIDIIAKKDSQKYMIECKYHNEGGIYTGVKVALYTYARFLDLRNKFDSPWLSCNTKLSSQAIKYAQCKGIKTTCWKYPKKESLEKLIEDKKLYPITIIKSVKNYEKRKFMQKNLMLVKDFLDKDIKTVKKKTGLGRKSLQKVIEEAKNIFYK